MSLIDLSSLLTKHGLLCHTFAYNDLPVKIKSELGYENQTCYRDNYLSLIANAGPRFWIELKANQVAWKDNEALSHPVDHFSKLVTRQLLEQAQLSDGAQILYPGEFPAPLILLGELAKWSTPSPLGLGLHPRYGPWFAYRALVKTTAPLHANNSTTMQISNGDRAESTHSVNRIEHWNKLAHSATTSPCQHCISKPCIAACPGNAVTANANFDIGQCADYRVKDGSNCKEQCHARNACPVGSEYRYSEEQCAYHMTHALQGLIAWTKDA